ncbi:MAG: two-component regulator propeller domain-containing protein, partial [Bacteroidota bacterium]|nr:two-component regulator propeller domain-containing protein [Bacteroidota bacterium]
MKTYQDSKGFIWVMTKNGIAQFDGIEFKNYTKKEGLPDFNIKSFVEDRNGMIWTLSKSGISRFTGERFIYYPPVGIGYENIIFQQVLKYFNDHLWFIGNYQGKTRLISFRDGIYTNHSKNNAIIDSLKIDYIQQAKNQNGILLVTNNKIYRWNRDSLIDITPDYTIEDLASLAKYYNCFNRRYSPVTFDWNKLYMIAQEDTLIAPKAATRKGSEILLMNDSIVSKLEWKREYPYNSMMDRDNILWVSSEGGLFKYYSNAFLNFTPDHGLNENIWSVVEDHSGNIWFASFTKGLQMYDGEKLHDRNEIFEVRDEPLYIGAKKLSNGKIFFPSNTGVLQWDGYEFSDVKWVRGQTEIVYENSNTNEIL